MPDPPMSWRQRVAVLPAVGAVSSLSPRLLALAAAAATAAVAVAVGLIVLRGAPPAPELILPRAVAPGASGAGGGAAGGVGGSDAAAADAGEGAAAEAEPDAYVHVAGAVGRPGVYRVRAGGRVTDVVDAAGGPATEADLDQLNLAAKVADGERVYVPRRGEAPPPLAAGSSGAGGRAGGMAAAGLVNLNTATLEQLEALPGVGPATAQAILDYRSEHGRFAQVQELLEVRGIGEAKLAAIRARVRV